MAKNKKQGLTGFIQSGMLFIGDPSYMAGDLSQPGSNELKMPHNPFYNFNSFSDSFADKDSNLNFKDSKDVHDFGRGIVLATDLPLNGRYTIKKRKNKDGNLEIKITILP